MIKTVIGNIAYCSWLLCFCFLALSQATKIIRSTGYKKKKGNIYRLGYSIREIQEVISIVGDLSIKKRLRRKIIFRRIGYLLMLVTVILIMVLNI